MGNRAAEQSYLCRLTYWVVYAFFAVLELFGDNLVFWVPFYYELKILILLLLQLPQFKFASQVYISLIQPWFRAKEKDIDALLDTAQAFINAKIQQGLQYAAVNGPAFMATLFTAAAAWQSQNPKPPVGPSAPRRVDKVQETVTEALPAARKAKARDVASAPMTYPANTGSLVDELKQRNGSPSSDLPVHAPIPTEIGAKEGERPPQLMEDDDDDGKKDR